MNYNDGNKELIAELKSKGITKYPHMGFFNIVASYFGSADKTTEQRIRVMHRTRLIENDGQCWVLK